MKIVRGLFYLTVIAFLTGQLVSFSVPGYPEVRVLFLDIVAGLTVVAWLVVRGIRNREKIGRIGKSILLFIGIAIISIIVNVGTYEKEQLVIGSLYLVRFATYAGLYFAVIDLFGDGRSKQRHYNILITVGVGSAVLGIAQYFLYPNLRNLAYLGWDPHYKRLFGAFLDPQFAGVVLVMTLILLSTRIERIFTNKTNNGVKGWRRIISAISIIIVLTALALTFSRSSYLALIGGGVVAITQIKQMPTDKTDRRKLWRLNRLGMLAVIILLVLWFVKPEGVGGNLLRRDTVDSRINSWGDATRIWKEKPIFGAGFNMYRYARGKYKRTQIERMLANQTNRAGAGTDNSFLFVLATTGILGFLAYLRIWRELVKSARVERTDTNVTSAIAAALFIHAGFNNTLFYPHIMWFFWVYFSQFRLPNKCRVSPS